MAGSTTNFSPLILEIIIFSTWIDHINHNMHYMHVGCGQQNQGWRGTASLNEEKQAK